MLTQGGMGDWNLIEIIIIEICASIEIKCILIVVDVDVDDISIKIYYI